MIELKKVNKTYYAGQRGVPALQDISLKIKPGEFVAIIGPSGSGKSTLLHVLGFLDRPENGSYKLGSRQVENLDDDSLAFLRNNLAGFIFQQFHLLPKMTALENVELPLVYAGKKNLKEKALEKLKAVGLSQRALHRPNQLSGGEQQRVAIARSLINEPLVLFADEPTGNLDSKSEREIIAILKKLNQQGKTVIMVTHEKEIAKKAGRIIQMRDGRIISDESVKAKEKNKVLLDPWSGFDLKKGFSQKQPVARSIEFIDHFRQAFKSIIGHKMRSALSMLGILIGVAAVIAMLALGQGARESIADRLASLGSNLLTVRPGSHQQHGVSLGVGEVTRFSLRDAEAIAQLPEVKGVSASVRGRGQIIYGNKNWNTSIEGVGADYHRIRASWPVVGRFFSQADLRSRQRVVLLGDTVARELFGNSNPVGAEVRINRVNFQVIGVLPSKGATGWRDQDDVVVMPVTTAMYRLLGKDYLDSIDVEVKSAGLIKDAQRSISQLMARRHRIRGDPEDAFRIRDMTEIQETLEETTQTMAWLLGSIAAISLLVGGIGIMNIMLVSVTERTKEIGLRKAVGAHRKDIMVQFLIESVVMSFLGGGFGVLVGVGLAWFLSFFFGWLTLVSFFSVALAAVFSLVVGIGFGLWPAHKAAQLNPIEALRYE